MEQSAHLSYDVQIDYMATPLNDNRELPNDTLIVIFDGNFQTDTVDVAVNHHLLKEVILTTDKISGLAGDIKVLPFQQIESISFRINNGKLIYVEPEKKHYNIRLTYLDNKAKIRFYRLFPGFR